MIVIGDVHGCYNELMELVDKLPKGKDLCFVGDLIDRGSDSKKVVDFVINNGHKSVMGNHEQMLVNCFVESDGGTTFTIKSVEERLWKYNGGRSAIKSFGDDLFNYLDWFKSLPLTIVHRNFIISHSYAIDGFNTGMVNLLWDRNLNGKPTKNLDSYINIYGHTPHEDGATQYHDKHWCIDTGCFFTGILTAIDTYTMRVYTNKDV